MSRFPIMSLRQVIERIAVLAAPRHRDLTRAMLAEFETIADPGERRRFAIGAIVAIARMAVSRYSSILHRAPSGLLNLPVDNLLTRDLPMPSLSTGPLLRRHATPFILAFTVLTVLLLAHFALGQFPRLSARGAEVRVLFEALLLMVPAVVALTVPMAVFIAVLWVFSGLGTHAEAVAGSRFHSDSRRLVIPVLAAAAVISALTFVSIDQILPRTNGRLATLLADSPVPQTDRSMTIAELRQAARSVRGNTDPSAVARAVEFEVEIQKKLALPAASLVLALAAATFGLRFERRRIWLATAASVIVFTGFYIALMAGEALADQQIISPVVGMWTANVLLVAVVMLLFPRAPASGSEPAAA